jgi:hypothetical protein
MKEPRSTWPPLIVATHQPAWIRWRDTLLTTAIWLLLVFLMLSEFRRFLGPYLERLGLRTLFARLGLSRADIDISWLQDLVRLNPYFLVVLALLVFLSGFALHTLKRLSRSLHEPKPQSLALATEAEHAGLGALEGYAGAATVAFDASLAEAALTQAPGNVRAIGSGEGLAELQGHDQAALTDARSLQISDIHIDAVGKYHIEDAKKRRERGASEKS